MEDNTSTSSRHIPLLLGICTVIGLVVGLNIPRYDSNITIFPNRGGSNNNLMGEVLGYIDAKYVDDTDSLGMDEAAINSLLEKLDPHTTYLSPEAVKQTTEEMDGSFKGIGIEFLMVNDTLQIITPISGGPAESAGIWSGDQIISVNDTTIAGVKVTEEQLYTMLRGEKGTHVQVKVKRGTDPTLRSMDITRDEIPVHSVTASYLLDERTAYIKMARFNHNTHQEFVDALIKLQPDAQKTVDLVLDLRGNPGGLLDQAIKVLSDFFPKDKLLVYTEGRSDKRREYKSSGRAQINIEHIAVLLDEGSASASEVVAGAIQDQDRGYIIGERSFGKGLVQEQYALSNGGALRVTVSRYYTPSGRCIQKDFSNRVDYENEHLHRSDSTQMLRKDTVAYFTGSGRKVYSGTGISPDVVVQENEIVRSALFGRTRTQVSSFVAKYMEGRQKSDFSADAATFEKTFTPDAEMWTRFRAHALTQGLKITEAEWKTVAPAAQIELKAALARSLFGSNGYQMVKNAQDPVIAKAMEYVRKPL
jgi:carboxyl-terminal processing protease